MRATKLVVDPSATTAKYQQAERVKLFNPDGSPFEAGGGGAELDYAYASDFVVTNPPGMEQFTPVLVACKVGNVVFLRGRVVISAEFDPEAFDFAQYGVQFPEHVRPAPYVDSDQLQADTMRIMTPVYDAGVATIWPITVNVANLKSEGVEEYSDLTVYFNKDAVGNLAFEVDFSTWYTTNS